MKMLIALTLVLGMANVSFAQEGETTAPVAKTHKKHTKKKQRGHARKKAKGKNKKRNHRGHAAPVDASAPANHDAAE